MVATQNLQKLLLGSICVILIIYVFESVFFMPQFLKMDFISVIQYPAEELETTTTIHPNDTLMWNMTEINPHGKVKEIPVTNWGQTYIDPLRVWCCVPTLPEFKRLAVIQQTWGKYCDKLLFFIGDNTQTKVEVFNVTQKLEDGSDYTLYNVVKLKLKRSGIDGRGENYDMYEKIWKMRRFLYLYHRNDYDWMIKADTDAWFSTPNFKGFAQYFDPNGDWWFGDVATHGWNMNVVYTTGGAYALSRGSINKLNRIYATKEFLSPSPESPLSCQDANVAEDVHLGFCLKSIGIFVTNSLDTQYRLRWSTYTKEDYVDNAFMDWNLSDWWYYDNRFRGQGMGKECCTEHMISFHHYKNKNLTKLFEYFSNLDQIYSEISKDNWMHHAIPPKPVTFLFNVSFADKIVDEYFNIEKLPNGQRIWKGVDNLWNYSSVSVSNTSKASIAMSDITTSLIFVICINFSFF